MANKLVQQQLQNILRSLNDHDLDKILANYEAVSNATIDKSCKMVSYKCYEAAMSYKSWSTNGYGRSEAEASNNCIKNFFEMVIEDENGLTALIKALKRGNDVPAATPQPQAKEPVEKAHNINNTLALNGSYGSSYAPAHDNNTSFDNRKDIEILSKNIGNISVIGNSKGPGDTVNMSQVEMDDLLLKMILEEGSHPTNTVNSNTNMRRSLPPQHPNIDLANKHHSNLHKAERLSIGGSNSNAEVEKNQNKENKENKEKKVLKENTYLYNSGGNETHSHEKEENRHENKYENNKHENKYENRHESKHGHATPPKSHKPKQSSVSKNVESKENKHHYHRQHSYDGYKGSAHKESSKDISEYNSATKCTCNCAEQLQKAKSKIESLEKKLKLLTEENKILKHWAMELKEKGLKSEFSTMASICQTKSIQEKLNENYKLTPHLHYNDHNSNMYEFPDKEYSSVQTDKSRSLSLDINAKNKVTPDSHQKRKNPPGYNKENNDSMERRDMRDVRKSIPKLNLGMLPHNQTKPNLSNYASPPQHPNIAVNKGHSHHHHHHAVHNSSGNHNYYEYGSGGTGSSKHLKK